MVIRKCYKVALFTINYRHVDRNFSVSYIAQAPVLLSFSQK